MTAVSGFARALCRDAAGSETAFLPRFTTLSDYARLRHHTPNAITTAKASVNQVMAYCMCSSRSCTSSGPGLGMPLGGTLIAISEQGLDARGNHLSFLIGGGNDGTFALKRTDDFDISDCAVIALATSAVLV